MADPRYRAVTTMLGSRVFDGHDVIATCPDMETAERIAAALNEMDREDPSDG